MEITYKQTFLLALVVGLFLMYLIKDFTIRNSTQRYSKDVKEEERETREFRKNISDVFISQNCRPNASVSSIEGFSSFPQFMQDFLYNKHCRHFPMLQDVPDKCGGAEQPWEVFLLLVVKSNPNNYDRREVLRKTWAKERVHNSVWIRRLFIVGTTGVGFEKVRQNKLLEHEQIEHNDILQWDFEDTFQNLTLKQVLFLEWMERRCPKAHFLFNGDDDVFANTDNMVEYLQGLYNNDGSKHLFAGHLMDYSVPIRDSLSKYFVPVQIMPSDLYPPYCSGGGFLLSHYTAMVIYNMSKSIPLIPIDDAYMGMCLAKAGLGPASHIGVKPLGMYIPHKYDEFDPCWYKQILLVHRFSSAGIYLMWNRINDPNLKCDRTMK